MKRNNKSKIQLLAISLLVGFVPAFTEPINPDKQKQDDVIVEQMVEISSWFVKISGYYPNHIVKDMDGWSPYNIRVILPGGAKSVIRGIDNYSDAIWCIYPEKQTVMVYSTAVNCDSTGTATHMYGENVAAMGMKEGFYELSDAEAQLAWENANNYESDYKQLWPRSKMVRRNSIPKLKKGRKCFICVRKFQVIMAYNILPELLPMFKAYVLDDDTNTQNIYYNPKDYSAKNWRIDCIVLGQNCYFE